MKIIKNTSLALLLAILIAAAFPVSVISEELPSAFPEVPVEETVPDAETDIVEESGPTPVTDIVGEAGMTPEKDIIEETGPAPQAYTIEDIPETEDISEIPDSYISDLPEEEIFSAADTANAEEAETEEGLETGSAEDDPSVPDIIYKTHVQDIGWMDEVSDGELSGTTGRSKRLEAITIRIEGNADLGLTYQTHVQDIGWMNWVSTNAVSGTEGKSKRLEAIRIQLTGKDKDKYDVYYCVHVQDIGWMNWVRNGAAAGTEGQSKRLEGIRILLVKKGGAAPWFPGDTTTDQNVPSILYRVHVQDRGWMNPVRNGAVAGTQGQSKRLEALTAELEKAPYPGSIQYRTHIQNIGWESKWHDAGEESGTTGQSKRLEAIQIRLTGEMADHYDIYYRTHVQNFGWLGWTKNGENAGSEGYSFRMEALQICLAPKGASAPGPTANAFRSMKVANQSSLDSVPGDKIITAFGGYSLSNALRSRLQSAVNTAESGGKHIGFVMMDIRTGQGIVYNADERFYSASTIKAPYVASVVYSNPSSIKKHESIMKLILQLSSNEAYYTLRKAYGTSPILNWFSIAGITNNEIQSSPFIHYSPRDLAKLWLLSYNLFESGGAGATVGSWMQSPNISIIRPVLAKRYNIRSKAGWINTANKAFSDAGIVYAGNGAYVLVILTNYPSSGESKLYPLIEALDACHQTIR